MALLNAQMTERAIKATKEEGYLTKHVLLVNQITDLIRP